MSELALSSGDRVVYPNQGVCRVTGVQAQEVAGQKLTFVTLEREEDGAKVMVPEAKIASIGLRRVASKSEVTGIFDYLRAETEKAALDWKQRARTNLDRMSQGGLRGLAEVVKGLQVLSELRPLPAKERELYDNARHLLVTEVAAALSTEPANAEDAIDLLLFPPGRERPKRTAEEFRAQGEDGELGDLDSDLLGMEGGELDLPSEEEEPAAEPSEEAAEAEPTAKPSRKRKARAEEIDDEETVVAGPALSPLQAAPEKSAPKKRGRPPKPKPPAEEAGPPPAPKKRGRPPKPKPEVSEPQAPKKRGRPPKPKAEGAEPTSRKKK